MPAETDSRSAEDRVLVDGDIPEEFQRELRGFADIARNPLEKPLATIGAVLVLAAVSYEAFTVASNYHPVAGLSVVAAAAVAYSLSKRFWAFQHHHIVRELAKDGELDRLRE